MSIKISGAENTAKYVWPFTKAIISGMSARYKTRFENARKCHRTSFGEPISKTQRLAVSYTCMHKNISEKKHKLRLAGNEKFTMVAFLD